MATFMKIIPARGMTITLGAIGGNCQDAFVPLTMGYQDRFIPHAQ